MILIPEIKDPVIYMNEASTTLNGAYVDYSPDSHEYSLRRSVIDGTANLISRGEYFIGSIDWHGLSLANYRKLKDAVGTVIRLWPYGRGPIPNTSPQSFYPYVDVIIKEVRPYHRNNAYYVDACIIRLESEKPYTLVRATDSGIPGPDT